MSQKSKEMPTVSLLTVKRGHGREAKAGGEAKRKIKRQSCSRKEESSGTRIASTQDEGIPSSFRGGFVSLIDHTCGRRKKEEQA